jgi:hypothetical protein
MAKEPEDLILRMLRDVRAVQAEHAGELRKIRQEMERHSEDFGGWREPFDKLEALLVKK